MSTERPVSVERLASSVRALLLRASEGDDALLEALAALGALAVCLDDGAAALEAVGMSAREAARLAERTGLMLARRAAQARTSASEDERLAAAIVSEGSRRALPWLRGEDGHVHRASPQPLRRVPEATLLALVRGELDGLRALEVADRATAHPRDREALSLLLGVTPARAAGGRAAPLLRLAADGASALRDPSQGRVVGSASTRADSRGRRLVVEAVRFPDGRLAVYASEPEVLTSVATPKKRGAALPRVVGSAPGYLELEGATDRVAVTIGGKRLELTLKR